MTWQTPTEFTGAVNWFRSRLPIGSDELVDDLAKAQEQAFWMAGVTRAQLAAEVKASLQDALAKGETFAAWKESVAPKLLHEWAGTVRNPSARMETIFINWTQQSYNNARFEQMRAPAVKRMRPFLMFDAVRDSRTSNICTVCDGTVLPADDPWWDTHRPQLHHRCRSGVRSLTERKAGRMGVTTKPPTIAADDGFGDAKPWKPDRRTMPRELRPEDRPK